MRHLIPIILLLCVSCGTIMPTEAEYLSAQEIIAVHADGDPVDAVSLSTAREIIDAYEDPGVDWWMIAGGALSLLAGVPYLGPRGRAIARIGAGAARRADPRGVVKAGLAYVGMARSGLPSGDSSQAVEKTSR